MANRIQLRRDTAANWTRVNPVLEDGEPGLEIDTNRVKYGDGNTTWTNLAYASTGGGGTGNVTLPLGGAIYEVPSPTFVGNAVVIKPADGSDPNQLLQIYPTIIEGNHVHLTSGNLAVTDIFLGDDDQYIRTRTDGGMTIGTNGGEINNGWAWTFGANAVLSVPYEGLIRATDDSISLQTYDTVANVTHGVRLGTGGSLFLEHITNNVPWLQIDTFAGNTRFQSNGGAIIKTDTFGSEWSWLFGNTGVLTTPGNVQVGSAGTYGNISFVNTIQANNYAYANGVSILSGIGGGTYGNTEVAAYLAGNVTTGNLTVGNLIVTGNSSVINTESYVVADNIIQMANANPADTLDLGFVAHRTVNSTLEHTGLVRDASAGNWRLFSNVVTQPGNTVDFTGAVYDDLIAGNITGTDFRFANGTSILSTVTVGSTYSNVNVEAYIGGNIGAFQTFSNANSATQATSINTINANLGAFQTYANTTFGVSSYGNTQVAAYLLTYPNVNAATVNITSGNITTLRAANFNSANAVISGGYISALTNVTVTTGNAGSWYAATINSTNGNIATLASANFSTANAVVTGGYATGLANISVTGNATVGNLIGTSSNVVLVAGSFTSSFLNNGAAIIGSNVTVSGNVTASGIAPFYAPNRPAFRVYGTSGAQIVAPVTVSSTHGVAVDFNQGSYYDNTTGIFTAPVPGLYHAYATLRVGSNNGLNQATIVKNNSTSGANVIAFWETDTNTGSAMHFAMTGYASMVAGDTLRLRVLTGNVNLDTNDSWGVTYIG
jgi:hypothetical protein